MSQISSNQVEISTTGSLQDLSERWEERHTSIENYVLFWFLSVNLLRRLKIKHSSWKGRVIGLFLITLLLLGVPLLLTTVASQWSVAQVWRWVIVGIVFSAITLSYPLYKRASTEMSALYRTIQDETGIKRMIAWDLRWFRLGVACPAGVLFAVIALTALLYTQEKTGAFHTPLGTLALFFILAYQVGENTINSIVMGIEAFCWSEYRYNLYSVAPIETIFLQRAIRGYDLVVFLNSIFMTLFIAGAAFLLSGTSYIYMGVLLVLLLVAFLDISLLFFLPRIAIQRIVRSAKNRAMLPLQNKLNALYEEYEDLNDHEFEALKRTEEIYNMTKSSSDRLLPLASFGKMIGSLLLPTITFYLAVAAETYLSMLLERVFR